jgi:hypothetical protein
MKHIFFEVNAETEIQISKGLLLTACENFFRSFPSISLRGLLLISVSNLVSQSLGFFDFTYQLWPILTSYAAENLSCWWLSLENHSLTNYFKEF